MTLKVSILGTKKKFITSPVVFINGTKKVLTKGITFINGEKVQIWGNTQYEFIYTRSNITSYSSSPIKYLYIDESKLLTFGYDPVAAGDYVLSTINTDNALSNNIISQVYWGDTVTYSPFESSENAYIFYMSKRDGTRNKVQFTKNGSASVINTYSQTAVPSGYSFIWSLPLNSGKNLWVASKQVRQGSYYITKHAVGYDTTVVATDLGGIDSEPDFDNGDFVACHTYNGQTITGWDITGIAFSINTGTAIQNKLVDGNYILVAGKKMGTLVSKVVKYATNGTVEWSISFDDSRRPLILGYDNGFYYVADTPVDTSVADQNTYIRKYIASTGQASNVITLDLEETGGTRIISWFAYPEKTKNGTLQMGMVGSGRTIYICKVFTD